MEKFFQDFRFALRVYAKHKSFTLIAILALVYWHRLKHRGIHSR